MATDLLFYDPAGSGEFYTTYEGRVDLLKTHTDWPSSWTHIIPGKFGGGSFTDLLFYDSAGTGEFYAADGYGGISLLRRHTGWVSPAGVPWTHIIPGEFSESGFTDLLFYDSAGTGAFYASDGQGGIQPLRTHSGWVSPAGIPWTHIIPGWFGGGGFTYLLFYDSAGTGAFYGTDKQGGIQRLRTHSGWVSPAGIPWTHIIPGSFGDSRFTDLLFYDSAGTGAFYASDGVYGIELLRTHTGWQSNGIPWTHIVPGDFGGSYFTDLLFYDGAGNLAFYTTDGQGGMGSLAEYTGWRSSWTRIIPGTFAPLRAVRLASQGSVRVP